MRSPLRLLTPLLLALVLAPHARADEAAVRAFLKEYIQAFNKQDVEAVSAMWTEDCSYVDRATGQRQDGRKAIVADLAAAFRSPTKPRLQGTVDRVRVVRPDLVSVEGTTTTTAAGSEPSVAEFTLLLAKHGDAWRIQSAEERPLRTPATADEALQPLEWLVGTWVDDVADAPVISTFRRAAVGPFMIRSIAVQEGEGARPLGTQIIGWDPRAGQLRVWTFNADGSFGEGVWSKVGDDSRIKSTQTLADGRTASGTYVLTRIDENTLSLLLVSQEVDGEPVAKSPPVKLVRVAAAAATSPSASTDRP